MSNPISRRDLLNLSMRSVAGAGLLSAVPGTGLLSQIERLATAGPSEAVPAIGAQSLVCIYFFGGGDDENLHHPSRGLHPSLSELRPLYDRKVLTVVANVATPVRRRSLAETPGEVMAERYSALRFLPNGFATPEWAARMAGVEPITGVGAYTFKTGVSLVAPGSVLRDGEQFENAAIREATGRLDPLRTSFPRTTLGKQLDDVSRLLRVREALGMKHQVFLVGTHGFTRSAQQTGTLSARYRELSQAVAAFHASTVEVGLANQVTLYTDGEHGTDSSDSEGARGARLILGNDIRQPFPGFHAHGLAARA